MNALIILHGNVALPTPQITHQLNHNPTPKNSKSKISQKVSTKPSIFMELPRGLGVLRIQSTHPEPPNQYLNYTHPKPQAILGIFQGATSGWGD
jgi:hypothetical protein